MPKIQPQLISMHQAEQEDNPAWLTLVGKIVFWFSVALFFKAFADAVG